MTTHDEVFTLSPQVLTHIDPFVNTHVFLSARLPSHWPHAHSLSILLLSFLSPSFFSQRHQLLPLHDETVRRKEEKLLGSAGIHKLFEEASSRWVGRRALGVSQEDFARARLETAKVGKTKPEKLSAPPAPPETPILTFCPLPTPCPHPAHTLPTPCPHPAHTLPTPYPPPTHTLPTPYPLPTHPLPTRYPPATHPLPTRYPGKAAICSGAAHFGDQRA